MERIPVADLPPEALDRLHTKVGGASWAGWAERVRGVGERGRALPPEALDRLHTEVGGCAAVSWGGWSTRPLTADPRCWRMGGCVQLSGALLARQAPQASPPRRSPCRSPPRTLFRAQALYRLSAGSQGVLTGCTSDMCVTGWTPRGIHWGDAAEAGPEDGPGLRQSSVAYQ